MPHRISFFAIALLLALLGACAQRPANYVVLLDNADGHASSLTLSNAGGHATIDQPRQAIGTDSARRGPGDVFTLADDEIRRVFGQAIDKAPPPPLTFTLFFKFDLTELTDESRQLLGAVVAAVVPRPAPEVSIVGHTDAAGTADFNYQLGLRRAEVVRRALLDAGVEPRLIEVSSHGANNPAVPTRPGATEPRNRRVEVIVR
jgi:outer membrane protein OmpA-like peptidoglycan-associated protein